jgi:SAM-dependent methyltransferase
MAIGDSSMNGPPQIFDRRLYALRRARSSGTDFLVRDTAAHLAQRSAAVNRRFEQALDLSSRPESFAELRSVAAHWTRSTLPGGSRGALVADEENLPFAEESFDLVTSVLSLHAVNDLPGALIQIRRALKPDGLFIAALFGGETLCELRQAFAAGESEVSGGASPRVAPLADVRDLGALLQRAGFALPVADVERTTVLYREFAGLVRDLRALGEANVLHQRRRKPMRRDMLAASLAHYSGTHGEADGRLRVTFEVVYLTGWRPHESQQKPLEPGSARARLADALRAQDEA